jgi:hypothetical protein
MQNAGIAMGVATADAATQVDIEDLPAICFVPPQPLERKAAPPVTRYVMPREQLPSVGGRIKMLWKDAKGDKWAWHSGTCTGIVEGPPIMHEITHDGCTAKDAVTMHELAKEAASGVHPWVLLPDAAPAPPMAGKPAAATATERVTRAQVRAGSAPPPAVLTVYTRRGFEYVGIEHARSEHVLMLRSVEQRCVHTGKLGIADEYVSLDVRELVTRGDAARAAAAREARDSAPVDDALIDTSPAPPAGLVREHNIWTLIERVDMAMEITDEPSLVHDALMEEAFGDTGDAYLVRSNGGSLDSARAKLYAAAARASDNRAMCTAATAMLIMTAAGANSQQVRIKSEGGVYREMRTPRTCAEKLRLPDCAEWLRAARNAIYLSILSLPGSHLISEVEGAALGDTVSDMVTTCKYKLDIDVANSSSAR